jgi:hypothetical protein
MSARTVLAHRSAVKEIWRRTRALGTVTYLMDFTPAAATAASKAVTAGENAHDTMFDMIAFLLKDDQWVRLRSMEHQNEVSSVLAVINQYFEQWNQAADDVEYQARTTGEKCDEWVTSNMAAYSSKFTLEELYEQKQTRWPPLQYMQDSTIVMLTDVAPTMRKLAEQLTQTEHMQLLNAITTLNVDPLMATLSLSTMRLAAIEQVVARETRNWDPAVWQAARGNVVAISLHITNWARFVPPASAGAPPGPSAAPPAPAPADKVAPRFNGSAESISWSTYRSLSTGTNAIDVAALAKVDATTLVKKIADGATHEDIKRSIASGGPANIGPSADVTAILGMRERMDDLFSTVANLGEYKEARVGHAFPTLASHLRKGELTSLSLGKVFLLLRHEFPHRLEGISVSSEDDAETLLPLNVEAARVMVNWLAPIDIALAPKNLSLWDNWTQDPGGLRAFFRIQEKLMFSGAKKDEVRKFLWSVVSKYEKDFAAWRLIGGATPKPTLTQLPDDLKHAYEEMVDVAKASERHRRIVHTAEARGSEAREERWLKIQESLLDRMARMEMDLARARDSGEADKSRRRHQSPERDRSHSPPPSAIKPSATGDEKPGEEKLRASEKRLRFEDERDSRSKDRDTGGSREKAENRAALSTAYAESRKVGRFPLAPELKPMDSLEFTRAVRKALKGSTWETFTTKSAEGKTVGPCFIAYMEQVTGRACHFGKRCRHSHNVDAAFNASVAKDVLNAMVADQR